MLNINRKLSKKGFSLIELMVAVAILAMAIFGIFNAFSSGWMGMANARDRTVATNYAQEILEDIKNTPFEKIHDESKSKIGDTKFYRTISLDPNTNPNTKEVTALVTWDNWRGSEKNVEASTLIYSQFSSKATSEAVTLVLYAKPYYNILPTSTDTMLIVLVKDINGNLVTDQEQSINFSVEDHVPSMGNVSPSSITTHNGKATVFFYPSGEYGTVVIEASSTDIDVTSDSVTLKITDEAVAIKLEANPVIISTEEPSVLTVSLLNASYIDPPPSNKIDEHLVTFNVIVGPGTITGPTSVLLNKDNGGINYTTLTPSGTPGIVTIVASSMDLESGVVNIPILGPAESISITATPSSIFLDEYSDIIITITDSAGNPVPVEDYSGLINLTITSLDSGWGTVDPETLNYPTQNTTIFTAVSAGEVNITADSAISGELSSDTVTIYIYEDLRILLTATPEIIMADGESSSTITATIVDLNNDIVTGGTHDILFEIVSGEGNLSDYFQTTTQTTQNGEASIKLTSTINPSLITVSARADNLTPDSVTVQSTIPKFISISADPNWLHINDQSNISITVEDSNGVSVDYTGSINLTLSGSGLGSIDTNTLSYPGEDTAYFTASSTGEVTITADGEGVNSYSIDIPILNEGETILTFADNITILEEGKIVSFDISIWGEPLVIVEMNIGWNSSSTLNEICFFPTTGPCFSYEPPVDSGESISFEPTTTTLPSGVSTISLYFSGDMNGETMTTIFYDNSVPQRQYGPLEFSVPN